MLFYVDLLSGVVNTDLTNRTQITSVGLKRGQIPVGVVFNIGGIPQNLPNTGAVMMTLKEVGKYDEDPVASIVGFTAPMTGNIYLAVLDADTAAIRALMNADDGNINNDVPSIQLMGEILYQNVGTDPWFPSQTINIILNNRVQQETDGQPSASQLRAILFDPTITALTGGTSADLDYLPTANLSLGIIRAVMIGGNLGFWQLIAGTTAADGVSIVHSLDYNAITNPRIWKIAGMMNLSLLIANADLSGLATANPGGGKPWLNGGVMQVGA